MKSISIICSEPMTAPAVRNRVEPFFTCFYNSGYQVNLLCQKDDQNIALVADYVNVYQVDIKNAKTSNFLLRAWVEFIGATTLLKKSKTISSDAVLIVIPSMFMAFNAPFVLKNKILFLDICDLSWEYLSERSIVHKVAKRAFRLWFKYTVNYFKGVIVTNPAELNCVKKYWKGKHAEVVPNGITQTQFDSLKLDHVPTNHPHEVLYLGNIGLAQDLECLVAAAEQLHNVTFNIVGTGTDFERISSIVENKKLKNVNLVGRVPWDEVKRYYERATILYAQLTPDYSTAIPSKLYEYLATGKFVIYGGVGQAKERMAIFNHNKVIPPCDVGALVEAIQEWIDTPEKHQLCLENRQKIKDLYIREKTALKLIKIVDAELSQ